MERLIKQVTAALRQTFVGCKTKIEVASPAKRVGGLLIWDGFVGVDQIDRQRMVRKALDAAIKGPDRTSITLILTVTPDEMRVMKAG